MHGKCQVKNMQLVNKIKLVGQGKQMKNWNKDHKIVNKLVMDSKEGVGGRERNSKMQMREELSLLVRTINLFLLI